jgi:hypothetical protein
MTIATTYPIPSAAQKYAKLIWGFVGFVVVVASTLVNYYANVMSPGWLAVVQAIVAALGLAGLTAQGNAPTPQTIVDLVEKFLPNHKLVEKASFVPLPAPPVVTPPLAAPEPPVQAPVAVAVMAPPTPPLSTPPA